MTGRVRQSNLSFTHPTTRCILPGADVAAGKWQMHEMEIYASGWFPQLSRTVREQIGRQRYLIPRIGKQTDVPLLIAFTC
jgi:hypothetical protein